MTRPMIFFLCVHHHKSTNLMFNLFIFLISRLLLNAIKHFQQMSYDFICLMK